MGSLIFNNDSSGSAKKRRQSAYRKDLELQMRERDAAKLRERYQDMSVDASGWLDPEKRPDRLKPLGGSGYFTDRSERNSKVRPYHTLFLYGKRSHDEDLALPSATVPGMPARVYGGAGPRALQMRTLRLDSAPGLRHYPLTEATAGPQAPTGSVNQAYNFYATRDLDRPSGYGSIVQPLVVPYVDNRPIIMPGRYDSGPEYHPKFNPFQNQGGGQVNSYKFETDRLKAQMLRDQDEQTRRMRRELDDERRRMLDQDADARRRMEAMRRDFEDRRREYERQRREAERVRIEYRDAPKSAPIVVRPSSTTLLSDMDDTRRRLIEERLKIEELLRAQKNQPDYTEVKILKRPPPPPTPEDGDKANQRIVDEFTKLKHKDKGARKTFRHLYPDIPETNKRLDMQQRALLLQQQSDLHKKPKVQTFQYELRERYGRPDWMDQTPTPFPHRLRHRDRLYTTGSLDGDLDRIYRRAEYTERSLDDADAILRLRAHRPSSADTLTDDTWLRPASVTVF